MLARLHQLAQPVGVDLGSRPVRAQHLEPVFLFQHPHNVQGIVFVSELLNLLPDRLVADVLDVLVLLGGLEARLRPLFQRPVKTSSKTRGPNQARGIFHKCVIVQNANELRLNVRRPVERIH